MKREKIAILPQLNDCQGNLSKKWFVYFSCKDPRTGQMKRHKVYKKLHQAKTAPERYKVAEKVINEFSEKLRAGWNPFIDNYAIYTDELRYEFAAKVYGKLKAGNTTFNYFGSEFIKKKATGLDKDTIDTYKSRLRIFNMWLDSKGFADVDITAISNDIIINFFNYLIVDQKLSKITSDKYRQLLKTVFNYAIDCKKLLVNPIYHLPMNTRVNDQTPRPIKDNDIKLFKDELMKDNQLWLAIQLEYYCFLRPGKEIRFLKIKYIDFARGMITIPKTISKTKRDKIIIIPDFFLNIIRNKYKLHQEPKEFYVIGKGGKPGKETVGKNSLRFRFVEIRKTLNMPEEYKLYSWKHTGNVKAAEANIPLYDRQQQNGHSSARTTEIYIKNKMGHDSPAIRKNFPSI